MYSGCCLNYLVSLPTHSFSQERFTDRTKGDRGLHTITTGTVGPFMVKVVLPIPAGSREGCVTLSASADSHDTVWSKRVWYQRTLDSFFLNLNLLYDCVTTIHRTNGALDRKKGNEAESCWLSLLSVPVIYAPMVPASLLPCVKLRRNGKQSKLQKALLFYLFNDTNSTLFSGQFYLFNISCSVQRGGEISFDSSFTVQVRKYLTFPSKDAAQTITRRTLHLTACFSSQLSWGSRWGHGELRWQRWALRRAALTVWCVLAIQIAGESSFIEQKWTKLKEKNLPSNMTNVRWLCALSQWRNSRILPNELYENIICLTALFCGWDGQLKSHSHAILQSQTHT